MFISTSLGQFNKTVVILCFIKLGMTIFMAFTCCCGVNAFIAYYHLTLHPTFTPRKANISFKFLKCNLRSSRFSISLERTFIECFLQLLYNNHMKTFLSCFAKDWSAKFSGFLLLAVVLWFKYYFQQIATTFTAKYNLILRK